MSRAQVKTINVLFFNWCPLEDTEGGGVSVYIRNTIKAIAARNTINVFFLNSGYYYDNETDDTYVRESELSNDWASVKSFDLVNSPMIAPMKSPADNIERFLHDESIVDLFADILSTNEIDVVHFNNFEGLTLPCLEVKCRFPEIRFVYSIHNYALFCPCVNFWTSMSQNCFAQKSRDCASCMVKYRLPATPVRKRFRLRQNSITYLLGRFETHVLNSLSYAIGREAYREEQFSSLFEEYRILQVSAINRLFDAVLAVSERVAQIAITNGVERSLVDVAYIGTKFAGVARPSHELPNDGILRLVYMGYMKEEKGFPFLIEALEAMDDEQLARINLTVAAKLSNFIAFKRMRNLGKRLNKLRYYNGYTHDQVAEILSQQDLGVVPVLWEDNMPQVAMEYASNGVPVLASSYGGASEISHNKLFKFEGGDIADFIAHIELFLDDRMALRGFWDSAIDLPSVDQHIEVLARYYGADVDGR